jgi:hypothetical protein
VSSALGELYSTEGLRSSRVSAAFHLRRDDHEGLVADDHRLMIEGVRAALAGAEDIEVVGEAINGAQVLSFPEPAKCSPLGIRLEMTYGTRTVLPWGDPSMPARIRSAQSNTVNPRTPPSASP